LEGTKELYKKTNKNERGSVMKRLIVIAAIGSIVLFVSHSQSALIEIAIEAEVTAVSDSGNLLEGNVNVGDTITGSYKFDSDTPDSSPIDPIVGHYWHYSIPHGISLNVGDLLFQTTPSNVEFLVLIVNNNSLGHDIYSIISYNNHIVDENLQVESISFALKDYSGQALIADDLPVLPPQIDDYKDENYLVIAGGREGGYGIGACITSVVLIPEPASIMLFTIGSYYVRKRYLKIKR
jgi:hypothetical protein